MLAGVADNRWGTPIYWTEPGDPVYDVDSTKYRIPPEFDTLRIPGDATSGDNADAEMVVYDYTGGTVALLSKASYDSVADRWTVTGGTISYLDSNGLASNVRDGDSRNFVTFRGQNGYVHVVTVEQANTGHVQHLMRVAVNDSAPSHLWPLNGHDDEATGMLAARARSARRARPPRMLCDRSGHRRCPRDKKRSVASEARNWSRC